MKTLLLLSIFIITIYADSYRLGRGYDIYTNDSIQLNLGGHIDAYIYNSESTSLGINQAGLLLSANIKQKFHFLTEIGSDDIYDYNFESKTSQSTNIQIMRLFATYDYMDALQFKIGIFLTPIGIYNPAYIPALRWSAFSPYVASGFFPKIIAGASINGKLRDEKDISYSIFYHHKGEYDTNKNNVIAKEFAGAEFRYHFGLKSKIAFNLGRYRSDDKKEICLFSGINFQIPFSKNEFSGELIYKDGQWQQQDGLLQEWKGYAFYTQYVQHIYKKNYLTFRYGQKKRFDVKIVKEWQDSNIVLGYVYRPQTALSYKVEYRHRERTGTIEVNSDEAMLSFGVIF